MIEYNYKNFKIYYDIELDKKSTKLYTADGYIFTSVDKKNPVLARRFHTEHTSKRGVTTAIKRLIENYIDFEWEEFYEVHGKEKKIVN
ncbi:MULTISPECIES: hypothetical protein [Legionella]|uniref:Uncharacterized protein n=1 Tax=Legionella drozanskii LLAP-1 TaxID=1212489 RepID=A0A0W0SXR2_9GAMM|nr:MULTISPECIES: hypothetical protein [Legionella]KTC88138.1 hypothetical protein Ldro_1757 [Legionella drozanskii LLAP-1]PJE07962.1 MAG: hypothetical protein CK430_13130 [Legionella sp.]